MSEPKPYVSLESIQRLFDESQDRSYELRRQATKRRNRRFLIVVALIALVIIGVAVLFITNTLPLAKF